MSTFQATYTNTTTMAESRLFEPLKLGSITLKHRVAMAPLTRFRASDDFIPLPYVVDYYAQRASVPGTLLVTEATYIDAANGGYPNVPGIYNQAQIDAWKKVTDAVHAKGSYIYQQMWALGRVASPEFAEAHGIPIKSSSPIALDSEHAEPEELTVDEIKETVQRYAQAAKNAMAAGFDGVEIHSANGSLVDQFIQDIVNQRTDSYGGSIENRNRFPLEVMQAVVDAIGADKTGIRLSPFSTFHGMRMQDPIPQFADLVQKLDKFGLSYIHLVESRVSGNEDVESSDSISPLIAAFHGPVLIAGGFRPASAKRLVEEEWKERDVVVVFGRYFVSTPDLVYRLQKGIEFNPYDRDTFYNAKSERGYTDQPFSTEFLKAQT
jgi:NADPH2 dehydrogenase